LRAIFENIFFEKVVLLRGKEFHGLHKNYPKKCNPWPQARKAKNRNIS